MQSKVRFGPGTITLIYMLLSLAWIFSSDSLVEKAFSSSSEMYLMAQTAKGTIFVLASSLLIYTLIRFFVKQQRGLTRSLQASYEEVFSQSPAAQIIFDLNSHRILEANQTARKQLKCNIDSKIESVFPRVVRSRASSWLTDCIQEPDESQRQALHEEVMGVDGSTIPSEFRFKKVEDKGLLYLQRLGEQWMYIKNLDHAQRLFESLQELSDVGFWEINLDLGSARFCSNVKGMLNLPLPANAELSQEELLTADNTVPIQKATDWLKTHPSGVFEQEVQVEVANRGLQYIVVHARRIQNDGDDVIVGTLVNSTLEKRIEQHLRAREAQLNTLIEKLPEGVLVIQEDDIVYANQAMVTMVGANSAQDLRKTRLERFIHPDEAEEVFGLLRQLRSKEIMEEGFVLRQLRRLDGEYFRAEISARLLTYNGRDSVQLLVRDMTHHFNMAEQLSHANSRLRALSISTIEILEAERKHIAGELHDDVGQSLTAIKMGARWLEKRLERKELTDKTDEIRHNCEDLMEKVRDMSLMLRPAQLDNLGLPAAIEWQAERILSSQPIKFHFDASGYVAVNDQDMELTAFRIIQESLTNVSRHAEATRVHVTLRSDEGELVIQVVDDGVGFDAEQQKNTFGMLNMKERVELANGTIDVHSSPEAGTEIMVTLPLRPAEIAFQPNLAVGEK